MPRKRQRAKRNFSLVGLLLLSFSCQHFSPKKSEKLVLVSIDGLRPEFYLDKSFNTPHLKAIREKGAFVRKMTSVFPTVTYPNHTTMVTGKLPKDHGVYSNTRFNQDKGPTTEWYWDEKHIQAETLWDIFEKRGEATASINWPVTLFANVDYLIPEIYKLKPWYTEESPRLVEKYSTKGLIPEINQYYKMKTFDGMDEADAWALKAFKYIYKNKSPKFTAVHFLKADKAQHETGRDSQETKKAIEELDQLVGEMVKTIDKNTCLMILGDHGFINYNKVIHINTLFKNKGWLTVDAKNKIKTWKIVAHKSGAQAAIYLRDESIAGEALAVLENQQSLGYTLVERDDLNDYGAYPGAFAAIYANDGYSIGGSTKVLIEKLKTTEANHGQAPELELMKTGLLEYNCGSKGLIAEELPNIQIFERIKTHLGL